MSEINPRCGVVQIGIREIEDLKIYPLSIADQYSLSEIITKALQKFFGVDGSGQINENIANSLSDIQFISFIIELLMSNLVEVLVLITDCGSREAAEALLKKITNDQAVEICSTIYSMNYENSIKNAISLFEKMTGKTPNENLKRPSLSLSQPIPSTVSTTSSENLSEKEV